MKPISNCLISFALAVLVVDAPAGEAARSNPGPVIQEFANPIVFRNPLLLSEDTPVVPTGPTLIDSSESTLVWSERLRMLTDQAASPEALDWLRVEEVPEQHRMTVFIDPVNGQDNTAWLGRPERPWKNLDAAIAFWARTPHLTFRIGPGTNFTGGFKMTAGMQLIGAGMARTVLLLTNVPTTNGKKTWIIDGASGRLHGKRVSHLTVDCNGGSPNWGTNCSVVGIDIHGAASGIEHVELRRMKSTGSVESFGLAGPLVRNCRVVDAVDGDGGYSAILIRNGEASGNYVDLSGAARRSDYCNGITPASGAERIFNNEIVGCTSGIYSDTVELYDRTLENVKIFGNQFRSMARNGAALRWIPINIGGEIIRDFTFVSNTAWLSGDAWADWGVIIDGTNAAVANGKTGTISNGVIAYNTFYSDGGAAGLLFNRYGTDLKVHDNVLIGVWTNKVTQIGGARVVID